VRTLEGVVEREAVPKNDPNLCSLSKARALLALACLATADPSRVHRRAQLLAYAAGTREMLLEHRHVVTVNRDVVEKFYPLLADVILEVRAVRLPCVRRASALSGSCFTGATAGQRRRGRHGVCCTLVCATLALLRARDAVRVSQDTSKADEKLVRLMQTDTVVRKVALTYILQRVTVGDVASAQPLLLAAKEVRSFVCGWLARELYRTDGAASIQALSDALLLDEGVCSCCWHTPLTCALTRCERCQALLLRHLPASLPL
jgi:hypothetical protein